jgi:Fe-S-cluster-containing hydrogenase component 2
MAAAPLLSRYRDPDGTNVDFSVLRRLPTAARDWDQIQATIRSQPAFAEISDDQIEWLVDEDNLEVHELERDQLLPIDNPEHLYFICEGQVAIGVFEQRAIDERRRKQKELAAQDKDDRSLLPLAPLAQVAKKNVAHFSEGDIFNASALATIPSQDMAAFSLTPVVVLRLERLALGQLTQMSPVLAHALGQSVEKSQRQFSGMTGVRQEIFDFYLRHGLSVSGPSVRVRQLDLCIDCKQCEEACQRRHAARRINLNGFRLGMLDFVFSCRTCSDQRCLTPCEHDAINYDKEKGEVIIDHTKCIGCSLCAQSCPYNSIDMVNVAEPEDETFNINLKEMLEKKGVLGKKAGKAPRRFANKCDHCTGYAEQACVSACPTGALVELDMQKLFVAEQGEKPGEKSKGGPIAVAPFVDSVGVKDAGLARIREGRFSSLIWGLGILAWLLVLGEVLLRRYAPELSISFQNLLAKGLTPELARLEVTYLAGSELALLCGYLGTGLMLISMTYPLRRRLRFFMTVANNKYWLDLHLMTGTMGPAFILLHSAFRLDTWVSIAFGSMVMVVVSGFLGRYLYTLVPSMVYGHEIEELALRGRIAAISTTVPEVESVARAAIRADQLQSRRTGQSTSLLGLLFWLVAEKIIRLFRTRSRYRQLRRLCSRRSAREVAQVIARIGQISRRAELAPRARLLLKSWKYLHVPFTVLMAVTTVIHIVISFEFSML